MTSRNSYSHGSKIVIFDINRKRTKCEIVTEFCPDTFTFSYCGNFVVFDAGDKCYVYDITSAEPHLVQCLQTFQDLSVSTEFTYYDPVEKGRFRSIAFLKYIDRGKTLVAATSEGVIYFFATNDYKLIDVKCMRDKLKFIEKINDRNIIIANGWYSIYLWNQTDNTVNLLPNINTGYAGCEINDLKTEDITRGFLYIIETNGCKVDDLSKKNAVNDLGKPKAEKVSLTNFNYLVGNIFSDYGDSLNIFMQSDNIDIRQCEIALEYMKCIYKTPVAHETVLPLLVIDGLSRLRLKKINAGIEVDYEKHLKEVYDVFCQYSKTKSVFSMVDTAIMMAKNILWAAQSCDADVAYNLVFKKYLKPVTDIIPDGSENISILVNSAVIIVEKQNNSNYIEDIGKYLSTVYKKKNFSTLVPYMYMKTLFHLIKNQPQEHRFNTLDEMFRVYYDNRLVQEGFAFYYARACDHFAWGYMFDYFSVHNTEMIVSDLRNVLKDYPNNVDILFALATYLVVVNGQKHQLNALPTMSMIVKKLFNFSLFKKSKIKPEKSIEKIFDLYPQLWEVKRTVFRMLKAFTLLPSVDQNKESLSSKLQRINQLLIKYYN